MKTCDALLSLLMVWGIGVTSCKFKIGPQLKVVKFSDFL